MNRCGTFSAEVSHTWSLHPPLLRRGSYRGSYSDSNHTRQQEKGFIQLGVKPNWLGFITWLVRGKWMSEECVCRCCNVLCRGALLHNGLRGQMRQNYSMKSSKLCSELWGEPPFGKRWIFGANSADPADCNLCILPISFNLLYFGFTNWGQASLLQDNQALSLVCSHHKTKLGRWSCSN